MLEARYFGRSNERGAWVRFVIFNVRQARCFRLLPVYFLFISVHDGGEHAREFNLYVVDYTM
jgi:hypothetical protein